MERWAAYCLRFATIGALTLAAACEPGAGSDPEPPEPVREGAVGVTDEPCPDAVDEELGCVHLGVLVDEGDGPTVPFAEAASEAARDFWADVNAGGGVAGYEVHVTRHVVEVDEDAAADPAAGETAGEVAVDAGEARAAAQLAAHAELAEQVLAMALLPTQAVTEELAAALDADDVLAVLPDWWSGWHEARWRSSTLLAAGYSHCLGSVLALDWYAQEHDRPHTVMAVGHAGRHGEDVAAGARAWTRAAAADWLGFVETGPAAEQGVDPAVQQILTDAPDVVHLALGPQETGEVVGKAAAQGFEGSFLGAAPGWEPELLDDPGQAQALRALYLHVAPWGHPAADTRAHAAMARALADEPPPHVGYVAGWVSSYPLLAALETAADGELTRTTLRAAAEDLEVDYGGALPTQPRYPASLEIPHTAVVSVPDADAPLGLRARGSASGGEVAAGFDHPADCAD